MFCKPRNIGDVVTTIGETDSIRPVLCLFEGVVTGAADGYWRMRSQQ